ncbi:MAG TPA: hypothetical protein VIL74_20600 [Pyrinomonadaceae bacterium]|jgi:hypothetical protein
MPELSTEILEKIQTLREISNGFSQPLEVYELLEIDWQTGAVYYSAIQTDDVSSVSMPVSPVNCLIIPKSYPAHFFEVESDSSLSDGKITLEIWDGGVLNPSTNLIEGAGNFADLVEANGEGTPAEVFFWFPAVELLLSVWQGHLRNSEDSDAEVWRGEIANGFRSPDLPLPRRAHYTECQAVFGGLLDSLAEIEENDCPYDIHLPGGTVGTPGFTSCPRKSPADCTARGVNPLFHLSHNSTEVTVLNNQTKGPQLYSISRGNESNLKEPVRVVMGVRRVRDMQVIAFRRDYNNNSPDKGFFNAMYEACEGPIESFQAVYVNGQQAAAQHYADRLGARGQSLIDSTSNQLSTHGYSGTAYLRYNFGWVNPGTVGPDNMRATAIVFGLNDVRVFLNESSYFSIWTHSRPWHIARMLCDKRWGFGLDYARLNIDSFIAAAAWSDAWVSFTDPDGTEYQFWRSVSAVELVSRSTQQQIEDMCLAGRFTRPFLFQGKIHIVPLKALTPEELAAAPVFTDVIDGTTVPNIVRDSEGKSSLTRSQKSDLDIPNRVEGTFHDSTKDWTEQTAPVAEDVDQQLRAGRVMGDHTRRVVTKKYSYLGVVQKGQAASLSYFLLYFGEFAEGGILNNLEIKFKCWFLDALTLYEGKVIKVVSDQLTRYGFDHFRIKSLKRSGNLMVEITAQAHDNDALDAFETGGTGEPDDPTYNFPTLKPPCQLEIENVSFANGVLSIAIGVC